MLRSSPSGSSYSGGLRDSPVPPAAPTVVTPVQNVVTLIPGSVFDTAFRPLAGVKVEIVDGPQAGASVTTDTAGQFSFSGTFIGAVTFRATKEGYLIATQTLDLSVSRHSCCISFSLKSLNPSLTLEAGTYTLTVTADNACKDIPSDLRTRTYTATIMPARDHPNTLYLVDVTGLFLSSFGFAIGVAGNYLAFTIDGPAFSEHLSAFTYLEIAGAGGASLETSSVSTISIPFSGSFESCVLRSEMSPYSNCFTTPADQKISHYHSACLKTIG